MKNLFEKYKKFNLKNRFVMAPMTRCMCDYKGIPNKNIKPFNGKPLVWWVLNSLEKSNIKKVIISTDSKDYISLIKTFGFTKVHFYIRSQKCSTC